MSLIQQALKRQQDEAKGKIVLPPPQLGSTQLAVKPQTPAKPPLFMPAPPVAAPEHSGDEQHEKLKLVPPPPSAPVSFVPPPVSTPSSSEVPPPPEMPVPVAPMSTLKFAPPPETEAPSQDAPVSVEPSVRDNTSGLKAARLLILLLLVAVAIYWFWWRPKNSAPTAETNTDAKSTAVATPKPAPSANGLTEGQPVVKHIGPLPDVKDIKTKVDAMKTAVAASHDELPEIGKGVETPAAPKPVVPAPVVPAPVVPAPVAVTPPAPVSEVKLAPAPPPPAVWPAITVNGVMPRDVKSQASAIINGNITSVGESVDGMTVIEVRQHGVLMEYKGEQRVIGIGRH